ncbi:isopeptide-forming domain-containing fimbrial protein [Lactobacillus equicursoris]|uniref:Isopeptide-forming domain-containing fimbrial protein n=1 Tax=Lactobacillus equicursoris TaxID=420645 RepID=A0A844FMP0_9LACO|nr:isopeptide-forming domain-containing fimbrial protein [Lactobacillus equicursoris]MST79861.1 isopeptide-forming domain-containing fimbrial protein [Lactobacillus equicursoris]
MSKFGRKLSHLFSALVLLLSVFVALPGLAKADTAPKTIKLTINDSSSSKDFKYNGYRIMTAEVNDQDKDAVKYTLNDKYEKAVLDAAKSVDKDVTDFTSFKAFLKKNEGSTNTGETSNMRKFADQLYKNIQSAKLDKDKTPDKTFNSGENTVDVDKEAGYYLLVDATADNADNPHNYSATLLTGLVNENKTLNVKPITPIVHKKVLEGPNAKTGNTRSYVDATDYNIGDEVPFMITGTIPSLIKSYDSYTYTFTDTLPEGLTLKEGSIQVHHEKVANDKYATGKPAKDSDILPTKDWTFSKNSDGSFEVKINDLKSLVESGTISTDDTIVVTYTAKLNDKAIIGGQGNTNKVNLTYSNNPNGTGTGTTTDRHAKVYTYELDVNKVTDGKALAGAGFTLYKGNGDKDEDKIAEITPDKAEEVNGVKNKFVFKGLQQGKYTLKETTVPKGYHKAADVTFTINAEYGGQNTAGATLKTLSVEKNSSDDNNTTFTAPEQDSNKEYSGIVSTNVNNISDKGFVLPSTGGMGRYIFLAVGALVVVAAVAFPSLKKKKLQ